MRKRGPKHSRRWLCLPLVLAVFGCRDVGPRVPGHGSAQHAEAAPTCLKYEPDVSRVSGRLTWNDEFGPPGFGEDTLHDQRLHVPILVLDTPVTVCADGESEFDTESVSDIKRMQLVGVGARDAAELREGSHLVVVGKLFQAQTAWHFTTVLMKVDSIWSYPESSGALTLRTPSTAPE